MRRGPIHGRSFSIQRRKDKKQSRTDKKRSRKGRKERGKNGQVKVSLLGAVVSLVKIRLPKKGSGQHLVRERRGERKKEESVLDGQV